MKKTNDKKVYDLIHYYPLITGTKKPEGYLLKFGCFTTQITWNLGSKTPKFLGGRCNV